MWFGFWELNHRREFALTPVGAWPQPIRIEAMYGKADELGLVGDEREDALALWPSMDRVYREKVTEELQAKADAGGGR